MFHIQLTMQVPLDEHAWLVRLLQKQRKKSSNTQKKSANE